MKNFTRFLTFIIFALVLTAPLCAQEEKKQTSVTFLLVNDIYEMEGKKGPDGKERGGFARYAAVVKAERASGKHIIVAHGGDTLSPSLMSGIDSGAHIIALTNLAPPDIFAPGNHEFDAGKDNFIKRMQEAKFPIYAANLRAEDGLPLPFIKDRSIVEFDGVKIGLTGAAYDASAKVSSPGDLKFSSTIGTMKEQGALLRKEGADFVVEVMHAQRGDALVLQQDRAADLLLTGHTHDMFIAYDEVSAIVESSNDAKYLTAVNVDILVSVKDGKRSAKWWPHFRIIDTADVTPDPETVALVSKYKEQLTKELEVPIGKTVGELDSRIGTLRTAETAVGNLIADAMRENMQTDIAIMNGGGIRAGKVYPAGTQLTRKDIIAELPFGNRLVAVEISGADLWDAIEHGIALLPEGNGRFPQLSGMTVTYDIAQPAGARVVAIAVNGVPVNKVKMYKLTLNDFSAKGGDGYDMFKKAKVLTLDSDDAPLLADAVIAYIKKKGSVDAKVEGRIKAK